VSTPLPFSDPTRRWFESAFAAPTEVQARGFAEITAGNHALLCAPTGSGKTLAAFLASIDALLTRPLPEESARCRVLYISPLKALTVDVERNLRSPLRGIAREAGRLGLNVPELRVAVRTGDTPADARRDMVRHPPDILITTPESLFLILTSAARSMLASVESVIVDEIHSMASAKRGAHLAVSLERVARLTSDDPQRIGLSATQRPLEEVARFLGGRGRDVRIVDAGSRKLLKVTVETPDPEPASEMDDAQTSGPAAAAGVGTTSRPRSVWPGLGPRILELIRAHRSTIVFVNSRRHAERLSAQLNELAASELVKAHHGSIAREQRAIVEEDLKAGRLPALVATSSLELGIDMGAVDLVIQVGSPGTVVSGMQRIGRAGHSVGEASTGVILPLHRADLLETAVLAERMQRAEVEITRVPRNPIDVLAQQIVAMVALEDWSVEDVRATVTRAYPFSDLGGRAFEATLDMLDGRYPSAEFAELRARIVWDRVGGNIRARPGAQRLAVISGGTIPDRGMYPVTLLDDGRRVGELDEEMVYELRAGETFTLGATTWRAAEITPQRVLVTPAPGEPGKLAFWHGDALGRPVEVGRAVGAFTRELARADERVTIARLEAAGCDQRSVVSLLGFLDEQREATGSLPDDRTLVIERFRDQIGDWRICVLSSLGARVHAPWALAIADRLRERLGVEVQAISSDDGLALRLPDTDELPETDLLFLDPEEVGDLVTRQLQGSPLFASRFRENAARALLLPRRRPGQRTPLWQQRQRSATLLSVASRHPSFPIMAETYRECLADHFDLDALRELMRAVRSREVRVVEVETPRASPWASSLLFEYIGQYMYEGDTPLAERRAQALTLDRELLAELLGSDDLRDLLDPRAIEECGLELQGLHGDPLRDPDEAVDLLRRLGDLSDAELEQRGVSPESTRLLVGGRRAIRVRIAGAERVIAADDAARYRDGLGIALPAGTAEAGGDNDTTMSSLGQLLLRYARGHPPFVADDPADRWDVSATEVDRDLQRLTRAGLLLSGNFRPQGRTREYCHPEVLARIRRRSLASLRSEVEAVEPLVLARFGLRWQGIGDPARGLERLDEIVGQLQGMALPVSVIERDVLPARMPTYRPALLDDLLAAGALVWIGRGPLGRDDGRVALYRREDVRRLAETARLEMAGELHARIRERLRRAPCFIGDLWTAAAGGSEPVRLEEVVEALWDLVWAGEVTNDTWAPLRFLAKGGRRSRLLPLQRLGPPRAQGRWSLVADLLDPAVTTTERLSAVAEQLLRRHGVVTRETLQVEAPAGGFAALYPVFRTMEEVGRCRRGYFVEGLGGAQFAVAGAVDGLRSHRHASSRTDVLAAVDPANPYGASLEWPQLHGRAARAAGAYVVLRDGELRAYLERGGRSLLTSGELGDAEIAGLVGIADRAGRLELLTIDGEPAPEAPLAAALLAGGFQRGARGLIRFAARPGSGIGASLSLSRSTR